MSPDEFIDYCRRVLARLREQPVDSPDLLDFISVREAADILRCESKTLYNWMQCGKLRPINPESRGRRFFNVQEIERCARKHAGLLS